MKTYKPYDPNEGLILPESIRDWLPENHLAHFISDVVDQLDLREMYESYEKGDLRGQPPYHPQMMTKVLFYAYCKGNLSSRKIERATYEDVAYRLLAANQHPDHDSIAAFRKRHLPALDGLFLQVLELCGATGLVKLGHVALDGTKIKANASKHKAMSYGRMEETESRLEAEITEIESWIHACLQEAEAIDAAEDKRYGKGWRGDELPAELQRRESRLEKIREAKKSLEEEAREKAVEVARSAEAKIEARRQKEAETGKKAPGREPREGSVEAAKPAEKAQRNFTDPESRIMKDGATKGFEQAYNAQAVVDHTSQVIVAYDLVDEANDKKQLVEQLIQVELNIGRKPKQASADAGYYTEAGVTDERLTGIDLYVAPDRLKHGEIPPIESPPTEGDPREASDSEISPAPTLKRSVTELMRDKLKTAVGRAVYALRKSIVEPVFGQIKEARGIRRFSLRGRVNAKAEWGLICLTHNLLKLFRAGGVRPAANAA